MLDSVAHIVEKYQIDLAQPSPFTIKFYKPVDYPSLCRELSYKSGAEIGVLKGEFSEILCRELPEVHIYSIDPWQVYEHRRMRGAREHEKIYQATKQKLSVYPNSTIIRKKSMDALADFPDGSLDFVYIDADHRFQFITNDIAEWSKKVRPGGLISGHDYGEGHVTYMYVHTKYVVNAWTAAYHIHPWFILDDDASGWSWLWVKH